jgi:hypothetical protein
MLKESTLITLTLLTALIGLLLDMRYGYDALARSGTLIWGFGDLVV